MDLIEAEFENGVLRPMRRLALRQGERVGLLLVRRPDPTRWDLARLSNAGAADDPTLAEQGLGDWAAALEREDNDHTAYEHTAYVAHCALARVGDPAIPTDEPTYEASISTIGCHHRLDPDTMGAAINLIANLFW